MTRLQLALSLARREENGLQRHLTRIGWEADRLEQLIARTLKLASLERPVEGLERVPVDIGELLQHITSDVGIEADANELGSLYKLNYPNAGFDARDASVGGGISVRTGRNTELLLRLDRFARNVTGIGGFGYREDRVFLTCHTDRR